MRIFDLSRRSRFLAKADGLQGPAGNLEAGYRPILLTILAAALLLRLAVA